MDWVTLLFSASGRINRAKYWIVHLVYIPLTAIAFLLLFSVRGNFPYFVLGAVYLACFYSITVAAIKRLHDRDKSGWWILFFWILPSVLAGYRFLTAEAMGSNIAWFVGLIITLWFYVEVGCLPGTSGPNRFGPNPLDKSSIVLPA
jgi:uncharacterized membrane protein YhaH (DUF805 family)